MALSHDRLGPAEAFGQPPRTGRFLFDLLAATAAIFISVVSLVVAIRGERTQRGLLAANSWPFLQLSEDQVSDEAKLDVENAGVGPAKIMTFEVFFDGKPVDGAVDLLRRCCGLPPTVPGKALPPIEGFGFGKVFNNVLRPGEHIITFQLKKMASSSNLFDRFTHDMSHLSFTACYCSVLGECWTSNMRDLTQTAIAACPVTQHQFTDGSGT
ncbi:MAG TPA: hypothetical protein VMB71_09685 [Acetobacteraceae bacterium]|nr:hypothetical protein [Acetobacteraceae bacterium]